MCGRLIFQIKKAQLEHKIIRLWVGPLFRMWVQKHLPFPSGKIPSEAYVIGNGLWDEEILLVNHDIGEAMVCDVFHIGEEA